MDTSVVTNILKSSSFSSDLIVLGVLYLFFVIYTLYFGRSRMISLIFAFFPAIFFYQNFPYLSNLLILKGDSMLLLNRVIIFFLFLVPFDIAIGRYIFSESVAEGSGHYLRVAGYALIGVILVLVFTYRFLSLDSVYNFSANIDALFNTPVKLFWWTIAPIGLLLL